MAEVTQTKKPTTRKTTSTKTVETTDSELKRENEQLKQDVSELHKQLLEMKKMFESAMASTQAQSTLNTKLDLEADIPVINLCRSKLNLSTGLHGSGEVYIFTQFGEIQDIPFQDLKLICKSNKRFAEEGAFYIADEQAVEKLRLERKYQNILNANTLENIFALDSQTVIKMFESASKTQKDYIVETIVEKLSRGQQVDANILVGLKQLTGKDFLNISPLMD